MKANGSPGFRNPLHLAPCSLLRSGAAVHTEPACLAAAHTEPACLAAHIELPAAATAGLECIEAAAVAVV